MAEKISTDIEEKAILKYLRGRKNPKTAEEIRFALGFDAKTCSKALKRLRNAGRATGVGTTRAMTYEVVLVSK